MCLETPCDPYNYTNLFDQRKISQSIKRNIISKNSKEKRKSLKKESDKMFKWYNYMDQQQQKSLWIKKMADSWTLQENSFQG
jgi:tryptophanyl-tRNA synthetase